MLCVKGNQKILHRSLVEASETHLPLDVCETSEQTHGRRVHRRLSVYEQLGAWAEDWPGLQRWLKVERWGERDGKLFAQTHYYITDLALSAPEFLVHGREHWSIENRLHWPKDVLLHEDSARQRSGVNAPANWSTVRHFFITAARRSGFESIAQAMRRFANQVHDVFLSLT